MDYNLWINKAVMKIGALEKGKDFIMCKNCESQKEKVLQAAVKKSK